MKKVNKKGKKKSCPGFTAGNGAALFTAAKSRRQTAPKNPKRRHLAPSS